MFLHFFINAWTCSHLSPLCSVLHIPICEPWCWNMHTNICPKVQNHPANCRFLYTSTMVRIWVYHKPSYIIYHKYYIFSISIIYYPSYIHLGCKKNMPDMTGSVLNHMDVLGIGAGSGAEPTRSPRKRPPPGEGPP